MTDEELAAQYFDEQQAPDMRRSGMPEEGIAHLRQRYLRDVALSAEAMTELRAYDELRGGLVQRGLLDPPPAE